MSRPLPHVPMGKREPLAGEAEIAAMHEKLANKLKPKAGLAERAGAGLPNQPAGFDSPAPLQLKWARPERHSRLLYTTCGRYRCFKTCTNEAHTVDKRWTYRVEKRVEDLWYYRLGEPVDSFTQAQAIAQADVEKARA